MRVCYLALLFALPAVAEDPVIDEWGEDEEWDEADEEWGEDRSDHELGTSIFGNAVRRRRIAGSAHEVDQKKLELFEHDDSARALAEVPGVYVRTEDGQGLRPNIGLRGASSDRSSKVTLMEDGILLAPAPYAAPAAYYFPLMTRMTGIEVFKGPASIKHGPNTVGGAINLRSRPISQEALSGEIDLAIGAYETAKAHAFVSARTDLAFGLVGSAMLEGAHLQSAGFKQLDRVGGDTGFDRTDFVLKTRIGTQESAAVYQAVELKLGWGGETSHETYLGLTDEDFRAQPNRRYAASQLGLMQWDHTQLEASYVLGLPGDVDVRVTAYRTDFARAWRKLNRFRNGPELALLMKNPDAGALGVFTSVLRGERDSELPSQALMIGTNARAYYAQGVQGVLSWTAELGALENTLEVGARVHADEVDRTHTEDGFDMRSGILVRDETDTLLLTRNRGSALAGAAYVHDELAWGKLLVVPGLRMELIATDFVDDLEDARAQNLQVAWMPGVGASYTLFDALTLLGGVHKGFSPVSPGQSAETLPEESVNYEAGARFGFANTRAEVVGFYNQYANLTGECTFSTGCGEVILGKQFNGGEVHVYGVEGSFAQGVRMPGGLWLQGELTYTMTESQFQNSFSSDNPQFGDVEAGDSLAYVPEHQGSFQLLLSGRTFDLATSVTFASEMRDTAGQGPIARGEGSDAYTLVDAVGSFQLFDETRLYLKADNIFNESYIASRRPFGARPGKPLSFMVGIKQSF